MSTNNKTVEQNQKLIEKLKQKEVVYMENLNNTLEKQKALNTKSQ